MNIPRFLCSARVSFAALGMTSLALAQGPASGAAGDATTRAAGSPTIASPPAAFTRPQAPETLPGHGLKEHDFFAAGVQSSRDGKGIVMVKHGQIVWSYYDASAKGAYYDATLMANGNLLLAHGQGVMIITPDKQVAWHYEVKPPEHEIDGAQPVGQNHVVFLQNGSPTAHILVANLTTGKIDKDIAVPLAAGANLKDPRYVHMQARRLRLTPQGTALIAYTSADKVAEYDETGREVWSAAVPSPWSAERLKNGNTLVESMKMDTIELNPQGETVWKFTKADIAAQGYIINKAQAAMRLPNGDTLITVNNETAWRPGDTPDAWAPVQAIEVTPAKKIVWALRDWENFTVVSTLQTLDDPRIQEPLHFGSFH